MTRSCLSSGTPTGFTGAWVMWPAARCWTAASPSTHQGSPTTTSERGAPTVSLSRPPLSPLCRATPRSLTTWALAWTVWWCRADPVVWDRPWGQWQAVRRQIFPQAAVQDTLTFPPAPPRGWMRWTIPSSESGRRTKISLRTWLNRCWRLSTFVSISQTSVGVVKSREETRRVTVR